MGKLIKVITCTFAQCANVIYNELGAWFRESALADVVFNYLSFADCSDNKVIDNIKPQTMTKTEMMEYDFITIHREYTFDDNSKQFEEFGNNRFFLQRAFGLPVIDDYPFRVILPAISNISEYAEYQNQMKVKKAMEFKMGHCIDVKFTDEHAETFWTMGTICKVETNRVLIHIPRFRAVWIAKDSDDIAKYGTHSG